MELSQLYKGKEKEIKCERRFVCALLEHNQAPSVGGLGPCAAQPIIHHQV